MIDETIETGASTETGAGESTEVEMFSVPKKDYDVTIQTLGALKKELKDLKKSKEEPKETSTTNTPDNTGLLQKSYLRAAGITHPEDVVLALETAKKWVMEVDVLVDDEDFKAKLEKSQTKRSNELATSNVRGGQGTSQAKNTPEYWIAKGTPPSVTDVPDRKTRATIARAMMGAAKSTKKFYND